MKVLFDTNILTFNPDDFSRFPGIIVITPEAVVQDASGEGGLSLFGVGP